MDPRWAQVADVLVGHSTALRAGERVMIAMGGLDCAPLTHALYEACIKAGALPQVQYLSGELRRALLLRGDERQLNWTPEIEAYGMEWADVYFGLRGGGPHDERGEISGSLPGRRSKRRRAPSRRCAGRRRAGAWCGCRTNRWLVKPGSI